MPKRGEKKVLLNAICTCPPSPRAAKSELRELGYRVLECDRTAAALELLQGEPAGGEAGLGLFHQVHPALVITDIVMPDMEGIELIRKLREDAPTIPILAISGGDHPLYLPAATGLGATAALAKPFAGDELLSLVRRLLGTV